jgi:hypothetical protein
MLTAFYNGSITVQKLQWLLLTWHNPTPEDGAGVLTHEGVAIL